MQVFYSIRKERQLMKQIRHNLLFRWFVGLPIHHAVWNHSVFSENRDRLPEQEVAEASFIEVLTLAERAGLLSKKHSSVVGAPIQAWASHKGFMPRTAATTMTRAGRGATPMQSGRARGAVSLIRARRLRSFARIKLKAAVYMSALQCWLYWATNSSIRETR